MSKNKRLLRMLAVATGTMFVALMTLPVATAGSLGLGERPCDQGFRVRACVHEVNFTCDQFQFYFDYVYTDPLWGTSGEGDFDWGWDYEVEDAGGVVQASNADSGSVTMNLPQEYVRQPSGVGGVTEMLEDGWTITMTATASDANPLSLEDEAIWTESWTCNGDSGLAIPNP